MNIGYTVYTKDGCSWCEKAKDLLTFLGEDFEVINTKHPEYREDLFSRLDYMGVAKPWTFPQIWGPDGYIPGGFAGLEKYLA